MGSAAERRWVFAVALIGASVLATSLSAAERAGSADTSCSSNQDVDLNGDDIPDVVVADPDAAVDGSYQAGSVTVLLGGGNGSRTIDLTTQGIDGGPADGDRFGAATAVYDADRDYCQDLVVAAPSRDVSGNPDAGAVWVVPGSPGGLDLDGSYVLTQDSPGFAGSAEPYDRFGAALSGEGYQLGIGSPGEDHNTVDSGSVYVVSLGDVRVVHQDTPGVPGRQERGDRFGEVVRVSGGHFMVGVPSEAIGTADDAGVAHVFQFGYEGPLHVATFSQATDGVSGASEAGDRFGASVDLAVWQPGGDLNMAVGVPGESLSGADADHGMVHGMYVVGHPGDSLGEFYTWHQDKVDILGVAEPEDRFGSSIDLLPVELADGPRQMALIVALESEGEDAQQGPVALVQAFPINSGGDIWFESDEHGVPTGVELEAAGATAHSGRVFLHEAGGAQVYGVSARNLYGADEATLTYGP